MNSRSTYFIFLIIILETFGSMAQNRIIDSISNLVKNDLNDTNKVIHLNRLCVENRKIDELEKSLDLADQALILSRSLKYKKGEAASLNGSGTVYYMQSNYNKALEFYFKALKILEDLNDKYGLARQYSNIAGVHDEKGNYPEALRYYFKSLSLIPEEKNMTRKDKMLFAILNSNIGIVYSGMGEYDKVPDYFFKSLKTVKELGDENGIGIQMGNLGNFYNRLAGTSKNKNGLNPRDTLYQTALGYYHKALKINEALGDKKNLAVWLSNIGSVYFALNNNSESLKYHDRSLQISRETENKNGVSISLGNIGVIYMKTGRYAEAEKHLVSALVLSDSLGLLKEQMETELSLSELFGLMGKHKVAFEHYKKYAEVKDSIFNEEKNKELTRHEMNYEFGKKDAASKAEQEKRDAVTEAEKKKQQMVLLLVSCVLILVFIFAGFVFRSLKITRKQKMQIEIKNKETEEQKLLIEEKNKDILDSIRYAKRIQQSLLPTEKYIDRNMRHLKIN